MMICKENEMMALQPIPETMEKKTVILKGTFISPVKCGERAIFTYNGQVMRTSTVSEILEITADYIKFETRNSIYIVSYHSLLPTPALKFEYSAAALDSSMTALSEGVWECGCKRNRGEADKITCHPEKKPGSCPPGGATYQV